MGVLSRRDLLELYEAALSCGLADSRRALLVNLDHKLVASLRQEDNPAAQILSDLAFLNRQQARIEGALPLAVWLENAVALTPLLPEADVFRRALACCGRLRHLPSPSGERTRYLLFGASCALVLAISALVAARMFPSHPGPPATAPSPALSSLTPPRMPPATVQLDEAELVMGSSPEEIQAAIESCKPTAFSDCGSDRFTTEAPQRAIVVSSFLLDRHEVTNERFVEWMNEQSDLIVDQRGVVLQGGRALAWSNRDERDHPLSRLRLQGDRWTVVGAADTPIVLVTWIGARRYCEARGGRLPTEAEWELAARGAERRTFAWGNEPPTCDRLVFARARGAECAVGGPGPQPIGSSNSDRTPLGVVGMSGNVREWVLDVFDGPYKACAAPCRDPGRDVRDDRGTIHVIRGCGWADSAGLCRAARRGHLSGDDVDESVGFRCASDVAR